MDVNSISKRLCLSFRKLLLIAVLALSVSSGQEPNPVEVRQNENQPVTLDDARGRARWMHELVHGALQVMHRDFFDDEGTASLPSQSLDDVFAEMAKTWAVEIRWLGVNATKGADHLPRNRFEEQAAEALKAGKMEYESIEGSRYRFAGAIRLQNQCLKCHVRDRTTLEDRVAGLVISFPMKIE